MIIQSIHAQSDVDWKQIQPFSMRILSATSVNTAVVKLGDVHTPAKPIVGEFRAVTDREDMIYETIVSLHVKAS
jgi:hypothetical protein